MKHKLISFLALTILVISFLVKEHPYFWIIFIGLIILYLSLTAYGVFQIKANYFLNSINKGKNDGIALTFDDGPDPETTPKILEILQREKIKACFFVIGKKAEKYPQLIAGIHKDGHILANHSFEHKHTIGFFSGKRLMADIEKCSAIIEQIIGEKPVFFRPPFGVTNPRYRSVLKKLGLTSIGWTGRSFDTVLQEKTSLVKRINKIVSNHSILLFHDNLDVTVRALPEIIDNCRKQGVKIISLQNLINIEPYA